MSLLGEAAPDFDDPLGLLAACHGRMRSFCDLLERLPAWIAQHGIDTEAVAGAQRVLRYFDVAAPLHHADEEQDLFPLLAAQPDAATLIERLLAEHAHLERNWDRLAAELRPLVAADATAGPGLQAAIDAFCSAYRAHIALEDTQLLPLAHARLQAGQLRAMGRHMAQRRQPAATDPA